MAGLAIEVRISPDNVLYHVTGSVQVALALWRYQLMASHHMFLVALQAQRQSR